MESGPRTNLSDSGDNPFQHPDSGFLNPDPAYTRATAAKSPWRSLGGSTILGSGLCCLSTYLIVLRCFRVGDGLQSLGGGGAVGQRRQRVCRLVDRCQHWTHGVDDTQLQRFPAVSLPVRCVIFLRSKSKVK